MNMCISEHRAHFFGALPFLLLLACPLMHVFMHGGRGGGSMAAHCNAIASSFEGIAAQLDAMAAGHRQMAEQANL